MEVDAQKVIDRLAGQVAAQAVRIAVLEAQLEQLTTPTVVDAVSVAGGAQTADQGAPASSRSA